MNPQLFGPVSDRLFAAGALDVFLTAVQMKKGRPGTLVTVLAPAGRARGALRRALPRDDDDRRAVRADVSARRSIARWVEVAVAGGPVRIKVAGRARRGAQRRAGVRRLPAHRRRDRPAGQGRAGRGAARPGARDPRSDDRSLISCHAALLPHDRDRLRQQPPAPRARPTRRSPPTSSRATSGSRAIDVRFVMGNDEHSQNVFRKARGAGPRAAGVLRPDGAASSATVWARLEHLVRRLHPHDRAAAPARPCRRWSSGRTTRGDIYEGALRGLVLRLLRGVQAGEGPGRRRCVRSTARSRTGSRRRTTSSGCRAYRDRLLAHYARASGVRRARVAAQRDAAAARRRPRGHLGQPRRPGVGHSAAVRSDERRLRLVRRADQLRRGGRATARDDALFDTLVAGRPARDRQGHHAVPLRRLAGDADERRAARCRGRSSATAGCCSRARR